MSISSQVSVALTNGKRSDAVGAILARKKLDLSSSLTPHILQLEQRILSGTIDLRAAMVLVTLYAVWVKDKDIELKSSLLLKGINIEPEGE